MPSHSINRRWFSGLGLRQARASGHEAAVEALHAHAGLVIGAAARVTGNLADGEDIAQDIAEKLLRSPPVQVASWPALLKTMAVNAAVDVVRRRRDWSDLPQPQAEPTPEAALSDSERAQALRSAVAALPERDGVLFSLYYFADLSQVEIAGQLEMTANAVGVAIHRLRKRLAADVRQRLDITATGDSQP